MKDFLEDEVFIGDEIAYLMPGMRHLVKGRVAKINRKTVTLRDGTVRYPKQFVKIN